METTTMTTPTGALAEAAMKIATRGAVAYLDKNHLQADASALAECLRSWVKIQMPQALKDAKEALAVGMGQVAEQTFAASMVLAGVEAAKEAGFPT